MLRRGRGDDENMFQRAELFRQAGGMATSPDEPIWMSAGKVAEGPLGSMLDKWRELPPSHKPSHIIFVDGRRITAREIERILANREAQN